jgi:hypothetical protein
MFLAEVDVSRGGAQRFSQRGAEGRRWGCFAQRRRGRRGEVSRGGAQRFFFTQRDEINAMEI